MLPKQNRANRKDVEKVFKKGLFLSSPTFTFRYLRGVDNKISFVVPKKVSKTAVKRNSLRRVGYNILQKNLNLIKTPIIAVFVFKNSNTHNLDEEIQNILKKLNS